MHRVQLGRSVAARAVGGSAAEAFLRVGWHEGQNPSMLSDLASGLERPRGLHNFLDWLLKLACLEHLFFPLLGSLLL